MPRCILGVILDLGKRERKPEKIVTEKKWPEGRKQESVVSEFQGKRNFKETGGEDQRGVKKSEGREGAAECGD